MLSKWFCWLGRILGCSKGAESDPAMRATAPRVENPPGFLYRFRSVRNLLDRDELKNQEVYFASPAELNDPMEGFRDIYWKGDQVVWRSLLRHYILCLESAFSLLCIGGEDHEIIWDEVPVFYAGEVHFTPQHTQMLDAIVREFIFDPGVDRWIKCVASRAIAIRRSELIAYLRGFHFFALSIIRKHYQARALLPPLELPEDMQERLRDASGLVAKMADAMQSMERRHQDAEHAFAEIFDAQHRIMSEMDLILAYNNADTPLGKSRQFVFATFSDEYVRHLETLAFPNWFTACFMQECHNSAIWGSYGKNHTAVCLKFKVHNRHGRPFIPLNRINGYGGAGPIYMDVEHEFLKVRYETGHMPVDFFRSIDRVAIDVLRRFWYTDVSGSESVCAGDIFKDEDSWRKKYWDAFQHAIVRKLEAWAYEGEYRLILSSSLFDLSDKARRKPKYKFEDLDGIIFGIKTPIETKVKIARIIEEKCREKGRTDFNFYQAYYSRATGRTEHSKMSLLKFAK